MSENQSMRKMKEPKRISIELWVEATSLATQKDMKDEKNTDEYREKYEEEKNYWKKYRITQFISCR